MSFFTELKRRNVFKAGVAYAIIAWLLIQVASILFPTFHAPEWVMQVFTLIIILGFLLAVFLAWAYELTPEGIKSSSSVGPDQNLNKTAGQRLNYIILGLVALAVGFLIVNRFVFEQESRLASSSISSIPTVTRPLKTAIENKETNSQIRWTSIILGMNDLISGSVGQRTYIALSPDGNHLVYAKEVDGV